MGSRYELTAIHENVRVAEKAVVKGIEEIHRIEKLISSWDPQSQTSEINTNAGNKPVVVDRELFDLIGRSLKVSELTNGVFDISFGPLGKLWNIENGKQLPSQQKIDSTRKLVNYKNIILDAANCSVFLSIPGMKIGFGAIGKGYSANRAKAIMRSLGIKNGMVNAGGDLTTWGHTIENKGWKIGIADPDKKEKYTGWIEVKNVSVVTSGNYEKFIEIDGKKYTHIIDPRTGYPSEGVKSVTIISPDAELSDALATSVFILGVGEGLKLISKLKNVECLIIDEKNQFWQSKGMKLNFY